MVTTALKNLTNSEEEKLYSTFKFSFIFKYSVLTYGKKFNKL